jgi:SAM-dependent methyltransferase
MNTYYWEDDKAHGSFEYNNKSQLSWKQKQLKFLFKFIDDNFVLDKNSRCLDIGCNAAANLCYLHDKYSCEQHQLFGFDLNESALSLAKSNLPNAIFEQCNFLLKNPLVNFDDDFFDICLCTWVLSHITPSEVRIHLIKDMVRTSKRGILYEAQSDPPANAYQYQEYYITGDPDIHNVVVWDDYTKYSELITPTNLSMAKKLPDGNTLYFWDKT